MRQGETPEQYKVRVAQYQAGKSGLPSLADVQSNALTLPQTNAPANNLMTFKDTLSQAIDLAKQNRNRQAAQFMTPLQGTVAASDFNSILSNLNQASNTVTQDALKGAIKETTPTYKTEQIGDSLYQYQVDATGKIIGRPTVVASNPSGKENPKEKANDIASAILDFQSQIQKKGWAGANPEAYNYYKNELVKTYGAAAALELDKAMTDAGISVDYGNK